MPKQPTCRPKKPPAESTLRRYELADFIDVFGEEMVKKCSSCVANNRVCRVHVRSGKCNVCNRSGQRCDVKVTQSEFKRLAAEKEKLKKQIQESRDKQEEAFKAHEAALAEMRVARAKEERLRQQMDLLDRRADEAIAVEERNIQELEQEEGAETMTFDGPSEGLSLQLSPSTWGAFEGWPLEAWEPEGFGDIVPVAGGSS
jgi:hypothetical protein